MQELDKAFEAEWWKIALIIDNFPAHPIIGNLKSIDLFYFSPNIFLQSKNQGYVGSLKAKYQNQEVHKLTLATDNEKPLLAISIIKVMKILVVSWNNVADITIQGCINKAGFSEELRDEDIEDNLFSALKQTLDVLQICDDQLIPEKIASPTFLMWMTVWLQLKELCQMKLFKKCKRLKQQMKMKKMYLNKSPTEKFENQTLQKYAN